MSTYKIAAEKLEAGKPLNQWDQIRLVEQAMNEHHKTNFDEWGNDAFASLINPHTGEGVSLESHTEFFRDLLLFIAEPTMAAKFKESIPYGLQHIKMLSDCFLELQRRSLYEAYTEYHSLTFYYEEKWDEFKACAKQYLTSKAFNHVMAANTDTE